MACPPRKKLKGESPLYERKKTVFVGNLPFDVKVILFLQALEMQIAYDKPLEFDPFFLFLFFYDNSFSG